VHDEQNPTPTGDHANTVGRHRERPGSVGVGCYIKVFPEKLGLRVHTPHDGSQNPAVAS
jgi:hypothetical protein